MASTIIVKDSASAAALAVAAAAQYAKHAATVSVDGGLANAVEVHAGSSAFINAVGAIAYFASHSADFKETAESDEWLHWTGRLLLPAAAAVVAAKPKADTFSADVNAYVLAHVEGSGAVKPSGAAVAHGVDLLSCITHLESHLTKVNGATAIPAAETSGRGVVGAYNAIDGAIVAALSSVVAAKLIPVDTVAPAVHAYINTVSALPWYKAAVAQVSTATTAVSGTKRKAEAGAAPKAVPVAGAGEAKPKAKKDKEAPKTATIDVAAIKSKAPVNINDHVHMRKPVIDILRDAFTAAIRSAFPAAAGITADISIASPKFAHHYQCNSALQLVSKLKGQEGAPTNPRAAAEALLAAANEVATREPAIGALEIAGPGYINIYVSPQFVAARAAYVLSNGVQPPVISRVRNVVVDYSSPNIAKEMHIGHLRSTIIGDTIARILEFMGHNVSRVNHVGDWGTQFGMLIAHLKDLSASGQNVDVSISDLTKFYKDAKKRFDVEPEFKDRAHKEVVALQAGDPTNIELWQKMIRVSQKMFDEVYTRLEVDPRLTLFGESFYNDKIPGVLAELQEKGLTTFSDAALVVQVPGFEVPLMVRKSDGGFGYDSTDLAAIKYRLQELKADWLIYVVDAGQSLHFDLVFRGAQMAGWYTPETARVEHVGFGIIQGEDGKRLKTRSGETVRLVDVLDEAVKLAKAELVERMEKGAGGVDTKLADETAAALGYGGVKYFDLKQNRLTDYVFNYQRMLSPDGDTAVYLEYAHARLRSILRKAADTGVDVEAVLSKTATEGIECTHATEVSLLCEVGKFSEALLAIEADLLPHHLAAFLYDLGAKIGEFHRDCYVLGNATPANVRDSRLRIVKVVADVMSQAMKLLGIKPLDRI